MPVATETPLVATETPAAESTEDAFAATTIVEWTRIGEEPKRFTIRSQGPFAQMQIDEGELDGTVVCGDTVFELGNEHLHTITAKQCPELLTTGAVVQFITTARWYFPAGVGGTLTFAEGNNGVWTEVNDLWVWRAVIKLTPDDSGIPPKIEIERMVG